MNKIKFRRVVKKKDVNNFRLDSLNSIWATLGYQSNTKLFGKPVEDSQRPAFSFMRSVFGLSRAKTIPFCTNFGYKPYERIGFVTKKHWSQIKEKIEQNEDLERRLRKWYSMTLRSKVTRGNTYSHRFWRGLPIKGQNARTNGKNARYLNIDRLPNNMRIKSGSTFLTVQGKKPSRIQSKKTQIQKQGISVKGQYARIPKKKIN
jgi:small subunit ribosomal protein S13